MKSKRKFNKGNVISSLVWQTLKEMTLPPKGERMTGMSRESDYSGLEDLVFSVSRETVNTLFVRNNR